MKISSGTIARTIWLIVALVNQCMIVLGRDVLPIAEDDVYQVVSIIFTIGAALSAWWKNNSFTRAAIVADEVMKIEKDRGEQECV